MALQRLLKYLLVLIVVLPLIWIAWLYLADPVVASRYISLFQAEDTTYQTLQPREPVPGSAGDDLPVAVFANRTITPDALDAMQSYAVKQNSWALIVIQYGVIQKEWYAPGWDRARLTQSQSMHKSVLPVLIQAAIEDGYINSLQDKLGDYLGEWRNDARGNISLQQLMWMSSGLKVYPFSLNPYSDAFLWLFGTDTTPVLLRTPLDREPGSLFEYNNINAELLGLVLERATGMRYADYLSRRLWQPMGAGNAGLWADRVGGKAHSSCCLLATAMDWARFGLLLLGGGEVNGKRIVAEEFIKQMVTPSPTSDWYGYQIWLGYSRELNPRATELAGGYQRTDPFVAEDTFYTSGFGAQRIYVVPSASLVIVRMGPASGRNPVDVSWDNTYLVNKALQNQSLF